MSKYVNIEELKKVVNEEFCLDFTKIILNNTINELSSADVVEVVRCEDCVHHYKGNCYRIEKVTLSVNADDFCSKGDRKETNG